MQEVRGGQHEVRKAGESFLANRVIIDDLIVNTVSSQHNNLLRNQIMSFQTDINNITQCPVLLFRFHSYSAPLNTNITET